MKLPKAFSKPYWGWGILFILSGPLFLVLIDTFHVFIGPKESDTYGRTLGHTLLSGDGYMIGPQDEKYKDNIFYVFYNETIYYGDYAIFFAAVFVAITIILFAFKLIKSQ